MRAIRRVRTYAGLNQLDTGVSPNFQNWVSAAHRAAWEESHRRSQQGLRTRSQRSTKLRKVPITLAPVNLGD